ncbi:hypothetical protein ACN5ZK_02260 [Macrococcoides bohemicum]|uniref:hypothetical protein n=1 Tax=Macrococcoides bohemicum TaxID=1903056 RepID=UPI003B0012EC
MDSTNEVEDSVIKKSKINFTTDAKSISPAEFIIVAVPMPISLDKTPELTPITFASELIGKNLLKQEKLLKR